MNLKEYVETDFLQGNDHMNITFKDIINDLDKLDKEEIAILKAKLEDINSKEIVREKVHS